MRFSFRPYEVEPSPAHPSGIIYRPVIPIWIGGPGGLHPHYGTLDTGADETLLPIRLARELAIPIDRAAPVIFRGFAGSPEVGRAYYGPVTFELRQSPRAYRWSVEVGFLASDSGADESPARITLGHVGFFRFFRAAFDHQRDRVEIRPNGLFSRVAERGGRHA